MNRREKIEKAKKEHRYNPHCWGANCSDCQEFDINLDDCERKEVIYKMLCTIGKMFAEIKDEGEVCEDTTEEFYNQLNDFNLDHILKK